MICHFRVLRWVYFGGLCILEICGLGVRLEACLVILEPRQVDEWIALNIGIFCEKSLIFIIGFGDLILASYYDFYGF